MPANHLPAVYIILRRTVARLSIRLSSENLDLAHFEDQSHTEIRAVRMLKIAALAVRAFLLLFGAVVLGLSVTLAKQQVVGAPPSETSFGSFCGAFGILVSLVGLAGLFIDKIPATVVLGADGLASALYLAGGIALTIALRPVSSCTSWDAWPRYERATNKLLTGGCQDVAGDLVCPGIGTENDVMSRCQRVQADYVFEYLAFVFGIAIVGLSFALRKRGGGSSATYV
ncbi:membrane-associating domain-containing protein [Durotheca rogersii]|uniref:membrane-associating domain-containing protein n=1 Tax=Durotheca rogersii TaxID=419775 RepID=UPI00221F7482|nr:membrane-associating domain-containing protein [Durotheca rogersii]KAI5855085.1 membrane-associating domain-containing protein [Durotheca rogersii]